MVNFGVSVAGVYFLWSSLVGSNYTKPDGRVYFCIFCTALWLLRWFQDGEKQTNIAKTEEAVSTSKTVKLKQTEESFKLKSGVDLNLIKIMHTRQCYNINDEAINIDNYYRKLYCDIFAQLLKRMGINRSIDFISAGCRIVIPGAEPNVVDHAAAINGTSRVKGLFNNNSKSNKKITKLEIGLKYESYIGYLHELAGWKVIFNGATKKMSDYGVDLICLKGKQVKIVQCKYWSKDKLVRENTVMQLEGSISYYKNIYTAREVSGELWSTANFSEDAIDIANNLGIYLVNKEFDNNRPLVKCNINSSTKEKIYHLPSDRAYHRIQIDFSKGEKYVSTPKDAEALGFRHANS